MQPPMKRMAGILVQFCFACIALFLGDNLTTPCPVGLILPILHPSKQIHWCSPSNQQFSWNILTPTTEVVRFLCSLYSSYLLKWIGSGLCQHDQDDSRKTNVRVAAPLTRLQSRRCSARKDMEITDY